MVRSGEPLQRTGGKPHMTEFAYRTGGVQVFVSAQYPNGLTMDQYQQLMARRPSARHQNWRTMRRDAQVYVRGRISHSDHATINLGCWHLVVMNTENRSAAMKHVAFLD
jgi:hypothetical protein